MAPGSRRRSEKRCSAIVSEAHSQDEDLSNTPLTATYITGAQGDPRFLALTVHEMVADNTSREILVTDMLTAFAQRLAGEDIVLQPATTDWREWSQRCAALATHPAVLDSRDYWLENAARRRCGWPITGRHASHPAPMTWPGCRRR